MSMAMIGRQPLCRRSFATATWPTNNNEFSELVEL
jgi:hypothetical protein